MTEKTSCDLRVSTPHGLIVHVLSFGILPPLLSLIFVLF